jgi:hypothetical protein
MGAYPNEEPKLREQAIARLKQKAGFARDVVAYVLVTGLVVGIWALTGRGFFWPVFLMGAWGIGVVFHAWDTFRPQAFSERQIRREIERLQ